MTQERFLKILDDPDLLATISYQEMKTLALAYPYAHNLRYLLALKAQQENHPEFDRTLAAASAYSLHRPRLFQLIAPQRAGIIEEVLELKAIEALQRELEARNPLPRRTETLQAEARATPFSENVRPEPAPSSSLTNEAPEEPGLNVPPPAAPVPTAPRFDQWLDQFNLSPLSSRAKQPASEAVRPSSADAAPAQAETADTSEKSPAPQTLAERSVTPKDEVVSETMARLFATQGHRERAIALYERLRLAFPEKSDYFAAEIDKLKK